VDKELLDQDYVVENSDILIIASPHLRYKEIVTDKPIVDIWNLRGNGSLV
jgi:UDP-N-acetyl-D-mannosaminuronic acid dehydrogenase